LEASRRRSGSSSIEPPLNAALFVKHTSWIIFLAEITFGWVLGLAMFYKAEGFEPTVGIEAADRTPEEVERVRDGALGVSHVKRAVFKVKDRSGFGGKGVADAISQEAYSVPAPVTKRSFLLPQNRTKKSFDKTKQGAIMQHP
jgi:hypothetical protein